MIFMGAFLGADELSLSVTPTNVEDITSVTVYDTVLDELYATNETSSEITEDIPQVWDFDTVMNANYDTSTAATNVDWTLETVTQLAVKRKLATDFNWTTIYVKDINELEDFAINETDTTPTTGDYLYAVVPLLNGIEGAYTTAEVEVEVTRLTLLDNDETWSTLITDGGLDTTNTTPGEFITTLNSKYPTYVANTIANYQTISVSGEWYPTNNYCDFSLMEDDATRIKYIKEFIDFLTNRKAKILKGVDGRRWLVMVDDGVSDSMNTSYKLRTISFSCVEIGDPDSVEDLAMFGLSEVPEEYW